jgi:hypothetical protein
VSSNCSSLKTTAGFLLVGEQLPRKISRMIKIEYFMSTIYNMKFLLQKKDHPVNTRQSFTKLIKPNYESG